MNGVGQGDLLWLGRNEYSTLGYYYDTQNGFEGTGMVTLMMIWEHGENKDCSIKRKMILYCNALQQCC